MRVEEYIKQLLYRYECVIVPGLGAFVTQSSPSTYLAQEHKFIPPSRKVTFNKAIQNHDGLLAETIAKGDNMDFESAKSKIQLFVKDFQTALSLDRVLEIPDLGTFSLDKEGKLSFDPDQKVNYFMESFGLGEVSIEKVAEPALEQAHQEPEKHPGDDQPKKETVSISEERNRKPYLKYAAVGLVAIGIASFAGLYQYNNYVVSYNDNEAQKAESLLQDKIQSAEFNYKLPELPLNTIKSEPLLPKYHIIAGAFRIESNAVKKVNLLQKKGYKASMLGVNAYGLYQVAFGSYAERGEALAQLRKIKTIENPEAWLFVKQL